MYKKHEEKINYFSDLKGPILLSNFTVFMASYK